MYRCDGAAAIEAVIRALADPTRQAVHERFANPRTFLKEIDP